MNQAEINPGNAADADLEIERQLERFEAVWRSGSIPELGAFLSIPKTDQAQRLRLLQELIKLDLEFRWRRPVRESALTDTLGPYPRLEAYLARFSELGSAAELTQDLIIEEFWVRQRFGDRPATAEYAERFPAQGQRLLDTLHERQVQLDLEFAPTLGSRSGPPRPPAPVEAEEPGRTVSTIHELIERIRRLELIGGTQWEEFVNDVAPDFTELRPLARELLTRGWLTAYQLNELVQGRDTDLVLGGYFILERLGEGSTGSVYKARHQRMNRLVALKILRRELLADPELLARFYREIQVVSQLQHPNVVLAYDAGPIDGRHVLVMEYAEGTDLACLVREQGPLKVEEACDYIAQTASGLQHILEQSLVHRDIKPSNLLRIADYGLRIERDTVTHKPQTAIIKILDLGLARLGRVVTGVPAGTRLPSGSSSGRLTPNSAIVVGTPDFLAPEQAMDFHAADIRADIYSLGCTLYYLLTGKPPFPATSLAAKLLRHQQDEPPALDVVRPDAPAWLNAVLHKMLAKNPADRYQTPNDVVRALTSAPGTGNETVPHTDPTVLPTIEEIQLPAPSLDEILMGAAPPPRPAAKKRPASLPVLEATPPPQPRAFGKLVPGVVVLLVLSLIGLIFYVMSSKQSNSLGTQRKVTALTRVLNFANGFEPGKGLFCNGSAVIRDRMLVLTGDEENQAGSVFSTNRVSVARFSCDFRFQLNRGKSPDIADGFTFTIQDSTPRALGTAGGGLGYGPDPQENLGRAAIRSSVAVKFDLYDNTGEGHNCTGLYTNGTAPALGGMTPIAGTTDLRGSGIDLHSGHAFHTVITYDGSILKTSMTDAATGKMASQSYRIDIPAVINSKSAYVGFTGSTGGATAIQTIQSWTFATAQ